MLAVIRFDFAVQLANTPLGHPGPDRVTTRNQPVSKLGYAVAAPHNVTHILPLSTPARSRSRPWNGACGGHVDSRSKQESG